MKTLIIYASQYGYTEDAVKALASQLEGESRLVRLGQDDQPDLSEADAVMIGGSIYMGQVQETIKAYCLAHEQELLARPLGLFLCCGMQENLQQYLKDAFPASLLNHAVTAGFGGELRTDRMKLMHRMITKMMTKAAAKENKPLPEPRPDQVSWLAREMNQRLV